MPLEGYLKTSEAAKFLDLDITWIQQHIKQGVLQGVRKGRNWYINVDDLVAYKTQREAALALSTQHKVETLAREILSEHPHIGLMSLYDQIAKRLNVVRETIMRNFPDSLKAQLKARKVIDKKPRKENARIKRALSLHKQGYNVEEIASACDVPVDRIKLWIRQRLHEKAINPKLATIAKINALYTQDVPVAAIAEQFGLSQSTVYKYIKAHKTSQAG